jgi:hypothetical protein
MAETKDCALTSSGDYLYDYRQPLLQEEGVGISLGVEQFYYVIV